MPSSLTASVVINTYNRVDYLRRLIPALLRQRDVEFEIVVVNGPSTDGTEALLQRYGDQIKVVSCPSRNLSQSRNLGIKAAAGDVVVFIDDDALPEDERWLYRFVKAFADSNPAPGAVGGDVLMGDTDFYEFREGATSEYGLHVFNRSAQGTSHVAWVRGVRAVM
jgi:Glycosyltransferases involved in cell wall biogenesis